MKIIKKDNFDRDSVSDVLIAENVDEHWSEIMASLLNQNFSGSNVADWFVSKPDDYKLYVYNPL